MKKTALIVLFALFVLVVSLLSFVPVLADTGDENLKKASQQALTEGEEVLFAKAKEIEIYVQVAAYDRVVTKDEMVTLGKIVDDFYGTKARIDKELADYGLKTTVTLDDGYSKSLRPYFISNILFKEDIHGAVRKFFASQTGKDVVVGRGVVIDVSGLGLMFIVGICFVVAVFGIIVAAVSKTKREDGIIVAIIFGAVVLIVFSTLLLV